MFCRSIWKSNGLEYEGLIKSIDMLDDQQYAFVQYLGKDLLRYGRNISPNLILWNLNFKLFLDFKSPEKQTIL